MVDEMLKGYTQQAVFRALNKRGLPRSLWLVKRRACVVEIQGASLHTLLKR